MKPKTLLAGLLIAGLLLSTVPAASATELLKPVTLLNVEALHGGPSSDTGSGNEGPACEPSETDTDGDGICDRRDNDDDNDGVCDSHDPHPDNVDDVSRWEDWITSLARGNCP